MEDFIAPVWLEKYRLSDVLRAHAYDKANSIHKAAIKTALAMHFASHIESEISYTKQEKQAFIFEKNSKAYELSLFIIDKSFTSPALFMAAIVPALLAHSSVCLLFFEEPSADILLCLELMGLEQAFLFDQTNSDCIQNLQKLCTQFNTVYSSFLCVSLKEKQADKADDFALFCSTQGIKLLTYTKEPVILIEKERKDYTELHYTFQTAYPNTKIYNSQEEIDFDFNCAQGLRQADISPIFEEEQASFGTKTFETSSDSYAEEYENPQDFREEIADFLALNQEKKIREEYNLAIFEKSPSLLLGRGCEWYIHELFPQEAFLKITQRIVYA